MREVIKTAATVEEAVQLGAQELGLSVDSVSYEVLQMPEKKFFLFKSKPAQVRIYEKEEDFDVKSLFGKEEAKEVKKEEKAAPKAKKEQPKEERKPQPKQEKKENKKSAPKQEKPAKEAVKEVVKEEIKAEAKPVETAVSVEELSDKAKYAMEFLESIIGQFHKGNYTLTPVKTETGYVIKISGDDVGALIGRKGETMEALSYLTGLAANRSDDSFEKISVDVADYRQKREKDLVASAKKAAAKVLKTGRPFGFEPMNPYDRRIIHAAIGQIDGVKSESKGEGASRRVMVYSTNPKPRYDKNKGGKKPYNKSNRREKPAPQAQKTRTEKLVDESSFGLYSKIDL
ncbi:MAG: Jag N-terminal domain-containing protein [Oscillospiraceae bacterium]|nr:Jag N-terminal domain-containing protein [Oscillospiraceae bacterium]